MAGVYVHVPFCRQACHYCDFHFSTSVKRVDDMVQSIIHEAKLRIEKQPAWSNQPFKTLYLGGGTPSLLSPKAIHHLISGVSGQLGIDLHLLEEVTLEANPEDLTPERLEAWSSAGVTRLSVGVQSFNDDTLAWMNRAHSGKEAQQGVLRAFNHGFSRLSLDLIYGAKTGREWSQDLDIALNLPINHLSAYALTIEPKTVFGNLKSRGRFSEVSESRVIHEYQLLCDRLNEQGWEHYETSNWAKKIVGSSGTNRAVHNSSYWSGLAYMGLGPGAHGFLDGCRYANVSNNPAYIESILMDELPELMDQLSSRDRYNEAIMTGLRTAEGISPLELSEHTGMTPERLEPELWKRALDKGWLIPSEEGRYRIPESSWITGDHLASSFFWVDAP